jgi:2-haloacid dehalogenase
MPIRLCVFDAYGTLFDAAGAARAAFAEPGRDRIAHLWPALARDWRQKQLEYSWHRAIAGPHADFWRVTQDGLDWALEANALGEEEGLRARLLELYAELPAFPEVPSVLSELRALGLATAILSNGTPSMLESAVRAAGLEGLLDALLSVEAAGIFKPARAVYDLVGARFGAAADEVLFASANGWDAAGAAGYGFVTAWINRAKAPVDKLAARPRHVLADLTPLPALARST